MSDQAPNPDLVSDAGAGRRFGVVASRWNAEIVDRLLVGAVATLQHYGVAESDIRVTRVPGAYELPMAATALARSGNVEAVICIGVLVRGDTPHFDVLAHSVASALQDAARETSVPMSFGVLTTENLAQAEARAGGEHGNKGAEAAEAALEMAVVFDELGT
jgi:6,7-dimethyl-8-ribityllumazine synthase